MKKLIVALSICLVLLLGVCLVLELRESELLPPETEPPSYSVRFEVLGNAVSQQELSGGELPQTFSAEISGVRITGWKDSQGQLVDPFATPISDDTSYQAVAYPELTEHVPFLFTDADGRLQPDVPLTFNALSQALKSLATPDAEAYFPELPAGSGAVTQAVLTELLAHFFEMDSVSAAFSGDQQITRAVFAQGMYDLLGRDTAEQLNLPAAYEIPMDVTIDREDCAILLEAAVAHTPAEAGITWTAVELPTAYEPGFVNIDGWLYYVQDDHYLLRDGYVGFLYFGADGRYTCGDAVLDETVATLLGDMMTQNPDSSRFEILRVVYDYCHQSFMYRRTYDHPAYGTQGWEVQRARDMFETGKGNCYSFSAVFWALSRGLGYQTRAISGVCLSDEQPHSWCIIELDGEDYIFDPQWQYDYTRRGIFDKDMFQIPMDRIGFWLYKWTEE